MPTLIAATVPPLAIAAPVMALAARNPSTTVVISAAVPLAVAWEAFVPVDLSEVFPKAKGPIPAVRGTSGQDGRWDVVGRSRSVHLSDSNIVREEITGSEPSGGVRPSGDVAMFSYRVSGFSGPLGRLANEAHGTWHFEQVSSNETSIRWTYIFVPKNLPSSVPLRLMMATFWRAYMRDGIENVRLIAEREQQR